MDNLDLLLHPIRMRIVRAASLDTTLSTAELCAQMPDVAQATMYRHVALLAQHGVLRVASEHQVRGTRERRYELNRELAAIDQDDAERMSKSDHRRAFVAAVSVLIADFEMYLTQADATPSSDSVAYRQIPLWLSTTELHELVHDVTAAIDHARAYRATPSRRLYLLSPILFPVARTTSAEPNKPQGR